MAESRKETFQSSGGRIAGFLGIAVAVAIAGWIVVETGLEQWPILAGLALGAAILWSVLIRPAVVLLEDRAVLRRATSDVSLPYAVIESALVRQFLVVRGAGKAWSTTGISRPTREMRAELKGKALPSPLSVESVLEQRLEQAGADARLLGHIEAGSAEHLAVLADVRRRMAWESVLPVVALGGVVLAVLVF